jgi:hypothetical protein
MISHLERCRMARFPRVEQNSSGCYACFAGCGVVPSPCARFPSEGSLRGGLPASGRGIVLPEFGWRGPAATQFLNSQFAERIIPTVLGFPQWFLRPGMHRCNAKNLQCAWALMPTVWPRTYEVGEYKRTARGSTKPKRTSHCGRTERQEIPGGR